MKIRLVKEGAYLAPFDSESEEWLNIKYDGQYFTCDIVTPRNYEFHKKFFALLNISFPNWNPKPVKTKFGKPEKDFETFREDVTILAGYYTQSYRLDGSVIVNAKSISFAAMDGEEFNKFYDKAIGVIIKHVLVGKTIEEVDQMVGTFL
jgi:hypothetical protein